jgi:phage terminase small subunit
MAGTLTPKQSEFVTQYLVDLNGKQAAIRAGYSAKTAEVQASKLLSLPKVAAEVARRQAERAKSVQVSQDYVLQRLIIEAEREGEGASHAARVSAASLLGKHLGMFIDRQVTDNTHRVIVEYMDDGNDNED